MISLRGCSHVFATRQVCQEPLQVLLREFARISPLIKQEEAANPVEISLLAAAAVMLAARSFNYAVVDPRCRLTKKQSRW